MSEAATAPAADAPISAREAGALISQPAPEPKEQNTEAEAPATAAEPVTESPSQEDDAAPPQEPSGEDEGKADPEEAPTIDPPRSWTKEDREVFASLPRETQERLLALDRTREIELRRGQNEAAEQRKAIAAEKQAAEQARQQYEQALPALLASLNGEYQREFGNPSWDEIGEWSRSEPEKYLRWDASYKRAQAIAAQVQQQAQQQDQETESARRDYVKQQDELFQKAFPDWFKDEKISSSKRTELHAYLHDVGYSPDELNAFSQFVPMYVHDHRFQLLAAKAMAHDAAVVASKKAPPKQVPPVQRPGTPPLKGEANVGRLRDLDTRLDRTGDVRDAARLLGAIRRRAS